MRTKLLTYSLLLITYSLFAQQTHFNWNDTVFTKGATKRVYVAWSLDSGGIRENSKDSLKPLVNFMKENPFFKIEIGNHTDPQGSEKHNMVLSHARAQSVVYYMISQGIDSARLVAKGYGFHKPLPGCSAFDIAQMKTKQEKQRAYQADRRTEVKIIGPDSGNIFNWGDDKFMKYSRRVIHVAYELDRAELRKDDSVYNQQILDSVVSFLKFNKTLKVAIYVSTDFTRTQTPKSQARSQSCVNYLIAHGIDSTRIQAKGWGFTRPLITQQQIDKMKTQEQKMEAYQKDRRTEIVILGTYKPVAKK